jgi:uncharacterized protein
MVSKHKTKRKGGAVDPPSLLDRIRKKARSAFRSAKGSHDWSHTERVLALCRHIGRRLKADMVVLELAALLHDIGRAAEDKAVGRMCHAKRGAIMARAILKKAGAGRKLVKRVGACIRTHRYRGEERPVACEARVLFDADKLNSIGAVGIGRAFLFAGEVGATVHDPEIDVKKTKAYSREDTAYREYLVKLRRIKARMLTAEGRRLAAARHRFMAAFFKRLNREVRGEI